MMGRTFAQACFAACDQYIQQAVECVVLIGCEVKIVSSLQEAQSVEQSILADEQRGRTE